MKPRTVFLLSSFSTPRHDAVKNELLAAGFEVLDYRDPCPIHPKRPGPEWDDGATPTTPPSEARRMMRKGRAQSIVARTAAYTRRAEIVVAVAPYGMSVSAELGLAVGMGKRTAVLLAEEQPRLMAALADYTAVTLPELVAFVARTDTEPGLWCWYVDHSEVSEEGGRFVDGDAAEWASTAVDMANAFEACGTSDGPMYDRARLVRTPYRAAEMNARDVYGPAL